MNICTIDYRSVKIPEFQKNSPLSTKTFAISRLSFSVNVFTLLKFGKSSPTLAIIKNIAKTLGVSSDELIFDKSESVASSKIFDRKLLEQFGLISMMRPHEQFAIKTVLEGMIVKSKLDEVMPYRKDTTWSKEMEKVISELRKGAEEYADEEIDEIVDEAVKAVRAEESYGEDKIEA